MKTKPFGTIYIILLSIVFYSLFWSEKMGLNILLFDLIAIAFLIIKDTDSMRQGLTRLTILGTLITAVLIVWNNSLFAKLIHLLSFTTMLGLAKQSELRFLVYGFFLSVVSFGKAPINLIRSFSRPIPGKSLQLAPVWRNFRLSLIPLVILSLFYGIYHFANPEFRTLSNNFWANLFDWLSWNISIPQMLFFIFGLFISIAILVKSDFPFFKNLQKRHQLILMRRKSSTPGLIRSMIALKNEFQSGLILLFSLNLLLLIVNILDIKNYWMGQPYELAPTEMKAMVHEGTYMLIFALLLAMIVLSFFFRKNLNFFPKNEKLKTLGYLWIVQNAILAITLFIKNYRYIEANGLAYKRIGVLIFLTLVFAGLLTMLIKIRKVKTFYYLLQTNAWIAYAVFILCCFVNWDVMITKYNLNHQSKNKVDYTFLLKDVSDKNIYLLMDQKRKGLLPDIKSKRIKTAIEHKKKQFLYKQKNLSWLSWNYADYRNKKYITNDN